MTVEFRFEDPPPSRSRRGRRRVWLEALLDEGSGRWAVYPYSTNSATPWQIKEAATDLGIPVETATRSGVIYVRVVVEP